MPITAQIATSIDIAAATNAGRPIVASSPDHPSSRAVRAMAATLAGQEESESEDLSDEGNTRRRRKRR